MAKYLKKNGCSMTRNIAIFLDLDNILIGANEVHLPVDIKLIVTTVEELVGGRAVLRYAYGDYRHYQQIPRLLTQAGFQLQSVVRLNNSDKNLADMQMVAEAVETMIDGYRYHCYVLVTGDRDFIPLVQVLRRHDKTVIGMGVKHTTSQSLVELCDHYIFYDDLFPDEVAVDSADLSHWFKQAAKLAFQNKAKVQASVFRGYVQQVSKGAFSQTLQGKGGFRRLLEQYSTIVKVELDETTLYVKPVEPYAPSKNGQVKQPAPYLQYRSALKKQGLRVIPPATRMLVLRDLLHLLKQQPQGLQWREVIDQLLRHYKKSNQDISKSSINDVLRLARRAKVIAVESAEGQSLTSSTVSLRLSGDKLLQNAVMYCDYAYLRGIKESADLTFDLEQASFALYESADHAPYLTHLLEYL